MDPEEEAAAAAEAALAAAAEGTPPPTEGDPPPVDQPVEGDPPVDPPVVVEEPPPAEPPPQPRGGRTFEARIGELSADKRQLKNRVAELEGLLRSAKPAASDAPPAEPPGEDPQRVNFTSVEEFNAAVEAEAIRRAEMTVWTERCNAVEDAGTAGEWGAERWKAAKRNLALLDDEGRLPYALLSVALETDNPEHVLLQLGEDPDRAAALLKMTPTKRALEIAKMTVTPKEAPKTPEPKPPPRSAAPDPVEPLRGRGAPPDQNAPTDTDDDATWLRKRNAQIQAQAVARAELARKLG